MLWLSLSHCFEASCWYLLCSDESGSRVSLLQPSYLGGQRQQCILHPSITGSLGSILFSPPSICAGQDTGGWLSQFPNAALRCHAKALDTLTCPFPGSSYTRLALCTRFALPHLGIPGLISSKRKASTATAKVEDAKAEDASLETEQQCAHACVALPNLGLFKLYKGFSSLAHAQAPSARHQLQPPRLRAPAQAQSSRMRRQQESWRSSSSRSPLDPRKGAATSARSG
eukprot:1157992-Pelagomonas_calceolata.AAC.2